VRRNDTIKKEKEMQHLKRENAPNLYQFYKLITKSETPSEYRTFQVQQVLVRVCSYISFCVFNLHFHWLARENNIFHVDQALVCWQLCCLNACLFCQDYYYVERLLCQETMDFLDESFSSSDYRAFSIRQFRALRAFKSDWLGLDKLNEKAEFQASMC
jgi:hypothetical protein